MKQLLLIVSLLLLNFGAVAQTTLNEANFSPAVGDRVISLACDTSGVFTSVGGPSRVWDYSWVRPTVAADTAYYSVCTDTMFCHYFPTATLIKQYNYGGSYAEYYASSPDSFVLLGSGSNEAFFWVNIWSHPVMKMKYPFNLNDVFTTSLHQVRADSVAEYDTAQYDGYGRLLLPGATYNNAIRLHFISVQYDSPVTYTPTFTHRITAVDSVAWFVPGIHGAVFGVCNIKTSFNAAVYFEKRVTLSQVTSTAAISNPTSDEEFELFPMPAHDHLSMQLRLKAACMVGISISDMAGRTVQQWMPRTYSQGISQWSVNIADLPPGVYMVQYSVDGRRSERRLTLD